MIQYSIHWGDFRLLPSLREGEWIRSLLGPGFGIFLTVDNKNRINLYAYILVETKKSESWIILIITQFRGDNNIFDVWVNMNKIHVQNIPTHWDSQSQPYKCPELEGREWWKLWSSGDASYLTGPSFTDMSTLNLPNNPCDRSYCTLTSKKTHLRYEKPAVQPVCLRSEPKTGIVLLVSYGKYDLG